MEDTLYKVVIDVGGTTNTTRNIITLYGSYEEVMQQLNAYNTVFVISQDAYVSTESQLLKNRR